MGTGVGVSVGCGVDVPTTSAVCFATGAGPLVDSVAVTPDGVDLSVFTRGGISAGDGVLGGFLEISGPGVSVGAG